MRTRSGRRTIGLSAFVVAGLGVAAVLAFGLSGQASTKPDGLNKVVIDKGLDKTEKPHAMKDLPTARYSVEGVHNRRLSTGLAGLIGVAVTFALGYGLVRLLRRTGRKRTSGVAPSAG